MKLTKTCKPLETTIHHQIIIKSFISGNTADRKEKQRDRSRQEHRNTLINTKELNYNSYSYENVKLVIIYLAYLFVY